MAYQKRNKGPRYATTGSIVKPGSPGLITAAYQYKAYLAAEMRKLQNAARQAIFRSRPYLGRCIVCDECDTLWFYVDYTKPQVIALCQRCHKEHSQRRGTIYDQLARHGLDIITWEDWKNGKRQINDKSTGGTRVTTGK